MTQRFQLLTTLFEAPTQIDKFNIPAHRQELEPTFPQRYP